jgi:hypothetical protein
LRRLEMREVLEDRVVSCIVCCGPGEHVEMTLERFEVAGRGKAIRLRAIPNGRGTIPNVKNQGSSGYKSSPETPQVFLSLPPLLTLNHQIV